MTNNKHPLPMFIIDTCSSDDNQELPIASKCNSFSRSFSLPNCGETYKDLYGTIHYSLSNRLKTFLTRSRSYPTNYRSDEKRFRFQSISTNLLDPYNGTHSPGGSSSRCSLYESFFDLSESGYYPLSVQSDKKLLTFDGHPLLTVENSSRLSTNTYQDKCNDWLRRLNTK